MTPAPVQLRRPLGAAAALIVALAHAPPAAAQGAGNGFLFQRPIGTFGVRAGFNRASAGSDIFTFVQDQLTLGRGAFDGLTGAAELAFHLDERFDLALGVAYGSTGSRSEFRNYVDQNNLPIEQTTRLEQVPLSASLRYRLGPRGRQVGRLAWVPAKVSPWLGAGGGLTWYRFKQTGDFVDFNNLNVFHDSFRSSGWAPGVHAAAGVDLALGPRFLLTGEGRYSHARAPMGGSFTGFDDIDLSGFSFTTGVSVRLNTGWAR